MGKRKKTSNEPQKGIPSTQQPVDVTSAKPESPSTMNPNSSGNIQLVTPTNSSVLLATDESSLEDSSNVMHPEMPPLLPSSYLLQNNSQASSKTQINDLSTSKSTIKEDGGSVQVMNNTTSSKAESNLRKDNQVTKDQNVSPEVTDNKEISKGTTIAQVSAPENALQIAEKIVENKLIPNESSSPNQKVLENISQENNSLTTQATISFPVQKEVEKLEPGKTSVSTSLPQTKNSNNILADSKNLAETENLPPSKASPKEFNSSKSHNQDEKTDLSSDKYDKDFHMMSQIPKPNLVSSDKTSIDKTSQENNQKYSLPDVKIGEIEGSVFISSNESVGTTLSAKEKTLQDPTIKEVTGSESHCPQPKEISTLKASSSKEALGKQKASDVQGKIEPLSLEKKDDKNKSHLTDNKIETEIGKAHSINSVIQNEKPSLSKENAQILATSLSIPASPKEVTEIKNLLDKNVGTKSKIEKSLNFSEFHQKQTSPDQPTGTVKLTESKASLQDEHIQNKIDTKPTVNTTGNEILSKVADSVPVVGKSPKNVLVETDISCIGSITANDENLELVPNSEIGSPQTPNSINSSKQNLKTENTVPTAKIVENKSDAYVMDSSESITVLKEGNATNMSVVCKSTCKTTVSEDMKEAMKKNVLKNEPSISISHDKKGINLEQKSDNKNSMIWKPNTEIISSVPDKSPPKKINKQEKQSTKDVIPEYAKKLDILMSKKLGTMFPVGDETSDDNKEKESNVTNSQADSSSIPVSETLLYPKNIKIQEATKKGQKQGNIGEVKTKVRDNSTKDKQPVIKDVAQKSSLSSKTAVDGTSANSDSALGSDNKQDENSISKKSKSKKSKRKLTNSKTPNISGAENTQSEILPECDKKGINKLASETKSQGKSGLLGLMQEVIEVMEKNNESGEKSKIDHLDGENETKKAKRSKNRKKSKPKECNETQEKDTNMKSQEESMKLPNADTNATEQKQENKTFDGENKGANVQKIKLEMTNNKSEETGKSFVKSKKGKRNTGKNKEESKQPSDRSKQNNATSKTNQPSTVDLISNSTTLDEPRDDGEAVIDDMNVGQTVKETSQLKKKRKNRKNKNKPSNNEDHDKVEDRENNETVPALEVLTGIKKNSNKIKLSENISTSFTNEINKNKNIKKSNLETKSEEIKQQKVSGILSGEQINHLTRTAVNLSQSLGDSDSFNLKLTPDIMRSLLAPKATDIFSSLEDDDEVEYRMVQRQIFVSYVCHVCKSMESKTCNLKKCNNCKLISYCSKKHQKDHWSAHKDMCTVISNICKREGLSHLFENAMGLVPNDYRLYRNHYANECARELGRQLQLWEKEMLYYPQVCHTCYECEVQKLRTCQNCSHVSYCSANHRKTDHDVWCKEFQIYRDLTLHQFHNGMIRPILPERVFDEYMPVTGDMESFLSKAYNITEKSVQMSKLHFVALTEVATCPFTVLFSLQNIGFPLKSINFLTIHLVGAEMFFEIDSIRKWEILFLHLLPSTKILKIVFVGPELSVDSALIKSLSETKVCQSCSSSGRKVIYEFWPGLYHDFMRSEMYGKPDLICAFNSGLYRPVDFGGMDTWSPTIEAIFKNSSIPVVVTEYTEQELPLDIARIQSISNSVNIVMSPIRNPFSSSKPSLNFLSEEKIPVIFKNFYITIIETRMQ